MKNTEARRKIARLLVEAKQIADAIAETECAYFIGMAGIAVIDAQSKAMEREGNGSETAIAASGTVIAISTSESQGARRRA